MGNFQYQEDVQLSDLPAVRYPCYMIGLAIFHLEEELNLIVDRTCPALHDLATILLLEHPFH